ncbi:MAG: exo-alpha-sialidase [Verrucomicrobia bacterium]|nr:exo-alpha-sialidase [Verrucomicrobiota bacterium]
MSPSSVLRLAAHSAVLLALAACGPTPSAPPPTTPAPAASVSATNAPHSHGSHGKGKRDVVRVGIESLDVAADGSTLHLLLADYATNSKSPALLHLRSTDAGANWSKPIRVDVGATPPLAPHRGMDAQLAASGSRLVAIWNAPGTGFGGRGPMATAISTDGGATWQPGPNPADDGLPSDHSFVDCAADALGNFHLVWLDSRGGPKGLRYANSRDGGKSWSKNSTLKPETCECCWNTVAVGADGSVHALFRDKNPRDMAVISSTDHGASWSDPAKVGQFNWDFAGCPHVGGGLIARGSTLHALVWTGATGHSGAYHLSSSDQGRSWSAPQRIGDADARRGDLASTGGQSLAAVWDRVSDGESIVLAATSNAGGTTWREARQLSANGINAAYPRVVAVAGGYRVFWTETAPGQPGAWKSAMLP